MPGHSTRYPIIITLDETTANAFHILEEFQSHDVVLKRLKRMKNEKAERDKKKDPFQKTFLERIRDVLGSTFSDQGHQIRARLHWFATSEWRRDELTREIQKQQNLTSMQKNISDSRGVNYHVDNLDAGSISYETNNGAMSGKYTDEYLSLLKENAILKNKITASYEVPVLCLPMSSENIDSVEKQKTTTELFLSAARYAPGKEEVTEFGTSELSSTDDAFFPTKSWSAAPGEKWQASENFEPVQSAKQSDKASEGIIDEAAKMLGALLSPPAENIACSQ